MRRDACAARQGRRAPGALRAALGALLLLTLAACESDDPAAAASPAPAAPRAAAPGAPALDLQAREMAHGQNRLGVNLPGVHDWSGTPVYADALRHARRFGTPQAPWDEKALLGEDGWPIGDFGVVVMTRQKERAGIAGTYTLRFRGEAQVSVIASPARLGAPRFDPARGLTTIELTLQPRTDQLMLAFTGVRGALKDLRLIRPGYDVDRPPLFTREFLEHIAPYKVVRLMDWLRTNDNPVGHWSLRATPQSTHYASAKGAPWEDAIALAREAGKDLWINVPALADDAYVRALARLLREGLPPATTLYVEYSNEVWNTQFSQSRQNREAAAREVASDRAAALDADAGGNPDLWGPRRVAQRAKQIGDIFRAEFGDAAMLTRVRPVYAVQIGNVWSTERALEYVARTFGPPRQYFYAIAGAPYFNLGPAQRREGLTVDDVLGAMSDSIGALPQTYALERNLFLAHWYQLPFIAYEGGADTFGPGSLAAKKAASLDPRLEALCRRYLDGWYAAGGGLFLWFTAGAGDWSTPYGTWELTPDLAVTDTPKIRCLQGVLQGERPALRGRNEVPGRIDALAVAGQAAPYGPASREALRGVRRGQRLDYLVLAPRAATYELVLNASADQPGNRIAVATAYGAEAAAVEVPSAGAERPADTAPLSIALRAGFNAVRLTAAGSGSGFHLRHLEFRLAPGEGNAR